MSGTIVSLLLLNYEQANITQKSLKIHFGGQRCNISEFALPRVSCQLPQNSDESARIEAGRPVRVVVGTIGLAILSDSTKAFTAKPIIKSLNNTKGCSKGGLITKISGENLPLTKSDDLQVKIGSSIAKILSVNNQELLIEVPPLVDSSNMLISYNGEQSNEFIGFSYDDSSAPSILSINPASSSPSLKKDIIISGLGFGNSISDISLRLEGVDQPENIYDLSIVSVTDTKIVAVLGGGRTGTYRLEVIKSSVGKALVSPATANVFKYEILVENLSPRRGTYNGGTILTITGRNFSPLKNQNQVFIGEDNLMCAILSCSTTQIKCRTPAVPLYYYNQWHDVIVTQRIVDEAVSLNKDLTKIFFYRDLAPELSSDNKEIETVVAGQRVSLIGNNLDSTQTPEVVKNKLYYFFNEGFSFILILRL